MGVVAGREPAYGGCLEVLENYFGSHKGKECQEGNLSAVPNVVKII